MPRRRIGVASNRTDQGINVDLDLFPGAGRNAQGISVDLDDVSSGRNEGGLFLAVPLEAFGTVPHDAGLLLAGALGTPELRYKLYRSNISGEELEELPGVDSASISLSNFRDHTWELSVSMRETEKLDAFAGWVKAVAFLRDPDALDGPTPGWQRFPLGLYRFRSPKGIKKRIPRSDTWELAGLSPEALLLGSSAYKGYTVPKNIGVLARVRLILTTTFGVPASRIIFPTDDVILTTATYFDPEDASAVKWLRICNALLAAGGFIALYTDNEGRFLTKKIEERSDRDPDVQYGSEILKERQVVDDIPYEYDDERFANRIVVKDEDVNKTPPIVGVAENHDPESEGSIENYGEIVQPDPIMLKNIASQAEANLIARARLAAASGFNLKLSLTTIPDPRRGARETYGLDLRRDDGTVVFDGNWTVTGWDMSLDRTAQSHEISRLVRL